jgi:uncharacterized protein YeaO (DUF488 family)
LRVGFEVLDQFGDSKRNLFVDLGVKNVASKENQKEICKTPTNLKFFLPKFNRTLHELEADQLKKFLQNFNQTLLELEAGQLKKLFQNFNRTLLELEADQLKKFLQNFIRTLLELEADQFKKC